MHLHSKLAPLRVARIAIANRSRPSGATSIRHPPSVRLHPRTPTVGVARAEPRRRKRPGHSPVAPESDAVALRHPSNLCLAGHLARGPANTRPIPRRAGTARLELRIRRAGIAYVSARHGLELFYYSPGSLKPCPSHGAHVPTVTH